MKNNPFLTASIIFGSICVLFLALSAILFLAHNTSFCSNIGRFLGMSSGSFTNTTLAELAVICSIPSLIFGYKSLSDDK